MSKDEFIKVYDELGNGTIDDLYMFSCLTTSGFDKDMAYELRGVLYDLWLDDETNTTPSTLSDMLYEQCEYYELDEILEMSTSELLEKMFC